MILYLLISVISVLSICFFNFIFSSVCFVELGFLHMLFLVVLGVVIEFTIDLIISGIVVVIPKKVFGGFNKVYKWERKFYDSLKIKKWKDLIPVGKGPIGIGISKKNLDNTQDISFLNRFIDDCFKAEVMHFFSMFFGFVLIFIFPIRYALIVSLPIVLVNVFLQILPFFVQRYNLPKLQTLLKRNILLQERKKKEPPNE